MSKLGNKLEITKKICINEPSLLDNLCDVSEKLAIVNKTHYEYTVSATFKTVVLAQLEDPYDIKQRGKRLLLEAVFGEFREDLYKLRESLYWRDYKQLDQQLLELETKMFT